MRFDAKQIQRISQAILQALLQERLIRLQTGEDRVAGRIARVIEADQKREVELEKEVESILEKNLKLLNREGADWRKMFQKVKSRLAEERGIVL